MSMSFLDAVRHRRSIYNLGKDVTLSQKQITELVQQTVQYTPSAYHSQSARVVVLFGQQHQTLWDITKEVLRGIVPAESFASTEQKLNSFAQGYGTVLFFEDQPTTKALQEKFPLYSDNFPLWSTQSSGMVQFAVWTALEAEGLGASLQHYNPLIDQKVHEQWNLPEDWKLMSEMPFGSVVAPPDDKSYMPIDQRVKVFK